MKPYVSFNKTLVKLIGEKTLLEYQVDWLNEHGVDHIVLAIDHQTHSRLREDKPQLLERLDCSIEKERLGTGGAVVKAMDLLDSPKFYLMNVDDIILSDKYTTLDLLNILEGNDGKKGSILLGRTRFPFGIVETSSNRVTGFRQKPVLDYNICSGHYAFTKEGVEIYFPEVGNFEESALLEMVKDGVLNSMELDGDWITVNNMKQLEEAKKKLSQ